MPSNKPVIDVNSFWVGVLEGVQSAFAKTQSGQVVGYQIGRGGNLIAIPDELTEKPTVETWLAFRNWAKSNLSNPFLVAEPYHTVKVVEETRKPVPHKSGSTRTTPKPAWLRESLAGAHDRGFKTYVDD